MTDYKTKFEGYDIIGDVHGCALALERLLEKLGYRSQQGCYRHPHRQAIFVGDIVDRGPHIRQALQLVKQMVEAGAAECVMGNHEYNAIGYTTRVSADPSADYIRPHTARHNRAIAETLEQFTEYPQEWREYLEWFRTLPLFLELPGFRVVHACWDESLIDEFKQTFGGNRVSEAFLQQSATRGTFAHRFMDRLTRGTDLPLPAGMTMYSREGYERRFFRTKFWARQPRIYRDVVFQPDPIPQALAEKPIAGEDAQNLLYYDESAPPVFVGHYWLQGTPKPVAPNVACLDYSAVKYGRLVAYRYDGEKELNADKFAWVYVDPQNR